MRPGQGRPSILQTKCHNSEKIIIENVWRILNSLACSFSFCFSLELINKLFSVTLVSGDVQQIGAHKDWAESIMPLVNKTRLAKRKLEVQEVRKEKQALTSKKHDKRCLTNGENSVKDALLTQLKALQGKIDKLEKEKNESEILIKELK